MRCDYCGTEAKETEAINWIRVEIDRVGVHAPTFSDPPLPRSGHFCCPGHMAAFYGGAGPRAETGEQAEQGR